MSSLSDLAEGIPVKISERYKPPPRIEIGRSVSESESRARHLLNVVGYDFSFERRILGKIGELRSARETFRSERRHRLRLLEEAKQRKIDEHNAAMEAAERLRQLSIAHVSYPSTDDMEEAHTSESEQTQMLRPVRLPPPSLAHPFDSDLLTELRMTAPRPPPVPRRDLAHLTVSDFEHDTSSPFDEVELQSINELEQLAQVLHSGVQNSPEQAACDNSMSVEQFGYGYYTCPVPSYSYIPQTMPPPVTYSRGVSDILSELADEVTRQRQVANQELALASTCPPIVPLPPVSSPSLHKIAVPKSEKLPDLYDELSPKLQELCRRVQGMGFPRERVARVVSLLGDSDKVVEGVLLVGQLLDLGFPESRVAAALEKHHFNRDKALDDLIA